MDIVQQFHIETELVSEMLKKERNASRIHVRVVICAGERALGHAERGASAPIAANLAADEMVTLLNEGTRIFLNLCRVAPVSMGLERHALAAFPTQQLVQRRARQFGLDVPESHVNAG